MKLPRDLNGEQLSRGEVSKRRHSSFLATFGWSPLREPTLVTRRMERETGIEPATNGLEGRTQKPDRYQLLAGIPDS